MALIEREQSPASGADAGVSAQRYWAFLSYSHTDGRAADRLHRWIERFRTPTALIGKPHPLGVVPAKLAPVFRDRHELAAGSSLGSEIQQALAASRYLIVLCSPAAVRSRWVDEEIRRFKRLHGEDRVLAAIVDGEPFTDGEDECLPAALRHRVGKDGRITRHKVEPIAADLRDDRDGWRTGALKIAAGLLDVGLDDLVRRDQQRRQRKMTLIAAASFLGMAFTTGLSVVAINARDAARDERREAESLIGFMLGDLRSELEPIGRLSALDKVGARALSFYERQDKTDLTDDQLAQRSRALTLLGQIATTRADMPGALARYREALRGTAELVARHPDDPQRLFDHAQNVFYIGDIARQRGAFGEAQQAYRDYQRLADRMVAAQPDNPKWRMEVIYARENLGIVLYNQRQFDAAAKEFAAGAAALDRLLRSGRAEPASVLEYSNVLGWLGDAYRDSGQLDRALAARKQQDSMLRGRVAADPQNVQLRQQWLFTQRALSNLYADTGQVAPMFEALRQAESTAAELVAGEPGNTTWRDALTGARLDLAERLVAHGRLTEAGAPLAQGCASGAALLGRDASHATWRWYAIQCLEVRARLAAANGDPDTARPLAQQAVQAARGIASGDPVKDRYLAADAYRLLGDLNRRGGDPAMARQNWETGRALLPGNVAERPRELLIRATLLDRLGRASEAAVLRQRLRTIGYERRPL